MPSCDEELSPNEMAFGRQDDYSAFRTFGCRVWVCPPGRQQAKVHANSRKGIFLGFLPNTDKNIFWCDPETDCIMIAKHAWFNEGMNEKFLPMAFTFSTYRMANPFQLRLKNP